MKLSFNLKLIFKIILLCFILFVYSCGQPRSEKNKLQLLSFSSPNSSLSNLGNNFNSTQATPVPTATSPNNTGETLPVGFSHCETQFALGSSNNFIHGNTSANHPVGPYNICKNANNEILFQPQLANNSEQVCFIPTTNALIGGSIISTYVGGAQCLFLNRAKGFYSFRLAANRVNYSGSVINGVVIVRDVLMQYGSPYNSSYNVSTAFFICMNYKALWAGNPFANPPEDAFCDTFRSNGGYINHQF